jgi:phosphoribosylformimino-5-aminoimidazole carboxamide ribotide isomerase
MLIPSIDLMGGRIVQLVQGEKLKLAFDDFEYWIERFSAYPLVQLIDLDAAMRKGDNRPLIEKITRRLPCQIGGGVRTPEQAQALLETGAKRVIFGSVLFRADAERPVDVDAASGIADAIGSEAFVASIDTKGGKVAIRGWQEQTTVSPLQALRLLEPYCGSFLYTHVDTEGMMTGFPFEVAESLRAATSRNLIVAGGIREQDEIDRLHAIGVDAVAGMAVYSGHLRA